MTGRAIMEPLYKHRIALCCYLNTEITGEGAEKKEGNGSVVVRAKQSCGRTN